MLPSRSHKPNKDNCPLEISVNIDDIGKALTLDEYKKEALNKITKDKNNSVEKVDNGVTLNKFDAYQIIWTRQEEGCKSKVLERGTLKLKKAYYIIYKAADNDYDNFWTVVEKIIASLEIKDNK